MNKGGNSAHFKHAIANVIPLDPLDFIIINIIIIIIITSYLLLLDY